MPTIKTIKLESFGVKPTTFQYMNPNREWLNTRTLEGVLDTSIEYDSINMLMSPRTLGNSFYANYKDEGVELNCETDGCVELDNTAEVSYVFTSPLDGIDGGIRYFNFIPLKDGLNENHDVSCDKNYRVYTSLNFCGYSPQLNFTTNFESKRYSNTGEFVIDVPTDLNPTPINDLDTVCMGFDGGDCPTNSDNIYWDNDGTQVCSWLSSGECDSVWMDRYYGVDTTEEDNSDIDSVSYLDIPSELILEPDGQYIIERSGGLTQNTSVNENDILFELGCVVGADVLDNSSNQINGLLMN